MGLRSIFTVMAGLVAGLAGETHAVATTCKLSTQPWLLNGTVRGNTLANHLLVVSDLGVGNSETRFNISGMGATTTLVPVGSGSVSGNSIKLQVFGGSFGKDQGFIAQSCSGTFSEDCTAINWGPAGCLQLPGDRSQKVTTWCGAWTEGCNSPPPPYGFGMSFWHTLGDNMVLQQGPAAAAVYGIATPTATAITVTVTDEASGVNYTVKATLGVNATHQPIGPAFAGLGSAAPGPYFAWKALLKPQSAGGNYTVFAECTGCTGTGDFSNDTLANVTFGDVWHCSGQSNMWLPLSSSFNINETIGNITAATGFKYRNIRMMAGNSGDGNSIVSNPWMTALDAASLLPVGIHNQPYRKILDFGATCWYFAQKLSDEMAAQGQPVIPIGLTDTAIGGQRIEEYMVNDTSLYECTDRTGGPAWNGHLYGTMTLPFVDMTVKGWLWYQGENNMGGTKGNSAASVGYSCEQKALVAGWRKVWSETPGTTDPNAPFGIVTLASSGSEGGPNMGAMRQAQTAGYGHLPGPTDSGMENTFSAQAYDLDDEWGPALGPCFAGFATEHGRTDGGWDCCPMKGHPVNTTSCTPDRAARCATACAADRNTPSHGGIHPRSKKHVGDRLGLAAFNTVYGGKGPVTGPTLSGCSVATGGSTLQVQFDATLLGGDTVEVRPFPPYLRNGGGSQLWVQVNKSRFCMEPRQWVNASGIPVAGVMHCPPWAGGDNTTLYNTTELDGGWVQLNYSLGSDKASIQVDLAPLNGTTPTAVRYAWGIVDCCDYSDPDLYVTHGCVANCPIMSSSALPANPFMAKITGGKCECIAPQVC